MEAVQKIRYIASAVLNMFLHSLRILRHLRLWVEFHETNVKVVHYIEGNDHSKTDHVLLLLS